MAVWDIAALPERDQFDYWREVICQAFVPLTPVRARTDGGFAGRVETRVLSAVTRARLSSQAQQTRHGPREVAATTDGWYFVNLQLAGRCHVQQGRSAAVVAPGQFVVVDTAAPFYLDMDGPWRMVSYRVPHAALDALGAPRVTTGTPIDGTGVGGVATAMMQALWDVADDAPAHTAAALEQAFAGAVRAAMAPAGPGPVGRSAMRAAVLAHVTHHLGDRRLSVTSVCRQFAISPRTLHNVFADGGDSFAATVRTMRLDRCATLLGDPSVTATVTQVAAAHGFDDPTSFARAFRRRFGISPREARHRSTCTNGTETVHTVHGRRPASA